MESDGSKRSFLEELKRRHVWGVATLYAAGAFIVWQVADIALPALGLPETVMTWIVVLALAGFPIAVGLAWVFEITSDGVKRTSQLDAIDPIERARNARPLSRGRRAGLVGTMSIAVLIGTWVVADRLSLLEREPELSHTALAVLPFQVLGSESLAYLREGMVDLLSRAMDGVGDLKSVDPVRVTQVVLADESLDGQGAEAMARRIGAGQFVTGSVNEVAGEIRISASLYSLHDSLVALSNSEVQGDTTELFTLVDRLTGELLAGRSLGAASEGVMRSAAMTTSSLAALKSFLEGEQLLRKAEFDSAGQAFTHAIEQDSSFATAFYRRAVTDGFRGEFDAARSSLARALEHSDAMNEHDRLLAAAYSAYMNGDLDDAVLQYRQLLRAYPEDLEAKVHLGRVLSRINPLRGRPLTEARQLLTEVLETDPEYQCTLCALWNLALTERDWDAVERYAGMLNALNHDGDSSPGLSDRIFLARARGQTAEVERLLVALDTVTDDDVRGHMHNAGHMVQAFFGDVRLEEKLLLATLERPTDYPEYAHAWEWLVVERNQGHMAKSLEYVRDLGRLDRSDHRPLFQQQMPWLLHFDPDVEIPRDQLEEARDYLEQLPAGLLHHDTEQQKEAAEALWEPLRIYYLGLVHSRLGSGSEAERQAVGLDERAAQLPRYAGLLDAWARTIRADVAYRDGAFDRVVAQVDGLTAPVAPEQMGFLMGTAKYARVLQTDALLELGRYREALRWLNHGPYAEDGTWLAFRSERRARAHEAVGDIEAAVVDYETFVEAWSDADPELQPRVEAARQRLAELR